jgi:hypothetical protein
MRAAPSDSHVTLKKVYCLCDGVQSFIRFRRLSDIPAAGAIRDFQYDGMNIDMEQSADSQMSHSICFN